MMHHPNMHHQPMSGHPPQHMPAHQGMPGHHQHQMPHQLHRENRHVTLTRVPLGAGQGAMGGHTHSHGQMGGMGALPVHHQRPPHQIRQMTHHPPAQHHSVPPQMKPMRRQYLGGGYAAGAPPAYPQPEHDTAPRHHVPPQPQPITGLRRPPSPSPVNSVMTGLTSQAKITSDFVVPPTPSVAPVDTNAAGDASLPASSGAETEEIATAGDEASRGPANSKEKTPMCLVNELARYNKIKHQYRLTSETGPAHKKIFTVTLRLGDTEEYTAEGSSIKRAQHAAAGAALAGTGFPPPPPRAHHTHNAHHAPHRHNGAVMPTVELNALAMKLCQPAVYSSVPPAPCVRARRPAHYRPPVMTPLTVCHPHPHPRGMSPPLLYRVRVMVGGRAWLGEGPTPQGARHDAAARALADLRPKPPPPQPQTANDSAGDADRTAGDTEAELLNSEVKSPVSLVHELALKRNLSVQFAVKSERGPPHMRVFITICTVGEIETEGEGNGKKVSKRRAAERMLEEMRRRWPSGLMRARPNNERRKPQPVKKKPRNLIKEGSVPCAEPGGADNPISRLAVARHAARARSPQYRVVEERGAARRREFLVQCDAPPHCATGHGPNKKTAKRRAAHNVLLAMEMANGENGAAVAVNSSDTNNGTADGTKINNDTKRKEGEVAGGASCEVRQPVPGVLMMDYHQRSGQPTQPNGVSETSAVGGAGGTSPGSKDQLMYLSQLLGFTVQFSDFPKRNHGEYLSLVSLSTVPPVMCHGGGPSTAHSHEQCALAALRALELMGLDAPSTSIQSVPGPKPGVINGAAE